MVDNLKPSRSVVTIKTEIVILVIAGLYALLVAGDMVPWIMDDPMRADCGYDWFKGWTDNGRPVATILYKVLTLGGGIIPLPPITELVGALLLASSGILLMRRYIPDCSNGLKLLALVPLMSPIYLSNLIWVFDSFTMSAGVFFAVTSFLISSSMTKPIWFKLFFGITLLALGLMCYQSVIEIFFAGVLFDIFISILIKEDSLDRTLKSCLIFILVFVAGIFVDRLCAHEKTYMADVTQLPPLRHFPRVIIHNCKDFLLATKLILHGSIFLAVKVALFLALFSSYVLTLSSHRSVLIKALFLLFFPIGSICALFGFYLPLSHPILSPRVFVSFGFLLFFGLLLVHYCCQLFFSRGIASRVSVVLTVVLLWCGLINAIELRNAHAAQLHYTDYTAAQFTPVLNDLLAKNKDAYLQSKGGFKQSYIFRRYAKHNGVIRNTEVWVHVLGYLETRFNVGEGQRRWRSGWDIPKGKKPLRKTSEYAIYEFGNVIGIELY